jgi:ABC-type sugar transport system permease subunit
MYPVAYEADFNPHPSRGTTFFRIILAIPWMIVALVYAIAFAVTHLFAWVAIIILGRYPAWLFNFNSGVIRFYIRTNAWVYLQTDAWPPFGIADDPSYPIRVNIAPAAERQSRLKALFRLILVLPMLVVSYAVNYMHLWIAVIAWLTIVFRGYLPEGVNNALTFVNSFYARVYGYIAFLTDDYPPIGVEAARSAGAVPPAAPPVPPAAPAV